MASGPPGTGPRHAAGATAHRARYQRARAQAERPSVANLHYCGRPRLPSGHPLPPVSLHEAGVTWAAVIRGRKACNGARAAELAQTRPLTPPSWSEYVNLVECITAMIPVKRKG
ncbi:hypothetical protein NDU88_003012 [Pleurodeles waltl]|uniref:Uncharacterized protein n=1 Tax=Pleurodeles waltl TaxID=8319 RepID=A0AAV7LHB5_PLEWA|nr:hypothetical protein NDU88_003012 [Pleurodeles waltl]